MRAASPQGRRRIDRTARRQPCADFIHTSQSPAGIPPPAAAAASAGVTPTAARESKTAGPARSRPTRQAHCAFEESGGEPKDACAIFANHRHVGEMAATIIATAVGPNLAPVWLGHRLSSCGQSFRLRGQTSSETWERSVCFDSHVQTGNACDPLRAGQAPKRVIITGMTVATDWLTD